MRNDLEETQEEKTLLLLGGSGFIGNATGEYFARCGWKIRLLTRVIRKYRTSFPCLQIQWNGKEIPEQAIQGVDTVINLAGAKIADERWTSSYRDLILRSRVDSTRALAQAIRRDKGNCPVVIQASAVGFFGLEERFEPCGENGTAGKDFLAQVCSAWEEEAKSMAGFTRLIIARIGLVLGWEGGVLPRLWDIYASGMGSALGNGRQWMNWIHLKDLVSFFFSAAQESQYNGTYNLVAPNNINNKTFHSFLASKTPSFAFLASPSFAVKTFMGKRADLLLKSAKVVSNELPKINFPFKFQYFSEAMEDLLAERTHLSLHYIKHKQWIPLTLKEVWDFVSLPHNLEKITPPWLNFHIKKITSENMDKGTKITYSLKLHGITLTWQSHISKWKPMSEFTDEQEKGPYHIWFHRHLFSEFAKGTLIEDLVEYRLPLFPLGEMALVLVKRDLELIFNYRSEAIANLF